MDEKNTIRIREYNSKTSRNEDTGQTIDVYTLAKSMTVENFAAMLDDFLNLGGKGFRQGKQIGLELRAGIYRPSQRGSNPDRQEACATYGGG
jgi:hypothetical protein